MFVVWMETVVGKRSKWLEFVGNDGVGVKYGANQDGGRWTPKISQRRPTTTQASTQRSLLTTGASHWSLASFGPALHHFYVIAGGTRGTCSNSVKSASIPTANN